MSLRINSEAPDFTAETTQGTISFHNWIGSSWAILFSHPKDFTPVCTTELGYMAGLKPQFDQRNTKIIGLSVDPVANHGRWAKDIEETQGHAVTYPMIGDPELKVAKLYDMLPADAGESAAGRTAADGGSLVRHILSLYLGVSGAIPASRKSEVNCSLTALSLPNVRKPSATRGCTMSPRAAACPKTLKLVVMTVGPSYFSASIACWRQSLVTSRKISAAAFLLRAARCSSVMETSPLTAGCSDMAANIHCVKTIWSSGLVAFTRHLLRSSP